MLLAAVAQRYEVTMVPGARVEPMPSITLRPRKWRVGETQETVSARSWVELSFSSASKRPS